MVSATKLEFFEGIKEEIASGLIACYLASGEA
jgi:hypothetical protein